MKELKEEFVMKEVKGVVRRILHDENIFFNPVTGKLEGNGQVFYDNKESNLIVDRASLFMARRMYPGTNWGVGLQYLAVGTGVGSGTTQEPEEAGVGQITLRKELYRKQITTYGYVDSSGGASANPTNRIQMSVTFTKTEAVGAIVEQGLLGGDAASGSVFGLVNGAQSSGNTILMGSINGFQSGDKVVIDGYGKEYEISTVTTPEGGGTLLTLTSSHNGVSNGQSVCKVNGYLFNYHTEAVVNKSDSVLMTIVWVVIF